MKALLRIFLCIGLFYSSLAQKSSPVVIADLSDKWYSYDTYYQAYIPLIDNKEHASKYLLIEASQYPGCTLHFDAKPGLTVLVGDKFIFRQADSTSGVNLLIDELISVSPGNQQIVTFFQEESKLPTKVHITRNVAIVQDLRRTEAENQLLVRYNVDLPTKILLLFLLFVILVSVLKRYYPRDFLFFLAPKREHLDDYLKPRMLGGAFWIIMLSIGLLASISFFLLYHEVTPDATVLFSTFGLILVAMVSKLIYNYILGVFFGTQKTVSQEFLEFLRVVLLSFLVIGTILVTAYLTFGFYLELRLEIFFAVVLLIMFITVSRMIMVQFNILNARNLHIISYICAAEILPLVVAARILLFR